MAFLLSAGNVDDCTEAVPLLKLLPDLKDCDILADKAYGTKGPVLTAIAVEHAEKPEEEVATFY